ncbi:hypothetical protein PR048_002101 [Dryococelus australis]|uniref:Uncharacterized protein n=1 Tax=Dryococelus australis TaxID=614101 RepID=A0ABQ9IJE3_9NEOP|nr:hypothetical protein PR048_002101 [Dryococelus australis]
MTFGYIVEPSPAATSAASSCTIWNGDESGLSIVQKREIIFASKGRHQAGVVTCTERGQYITYAFCMGSACYYIIHKYFDVLEYEKEHGIVFLCHSLHCTHRIQPLDTAISPIDGNIFTEFLSELAITIDSQKYANITVDTSQLKSENSKQHNAQSRGVNYFVIRLTSVETPEEIVFLPAKAGGNLPVLSGTSSGPMSKRRHHEGT